MENKNNIVWVALGGIILGFLVGVFCFRGSGMMNGQYANTHMMNNGHVMNNDEMDMDSMMGGMMNGLEGKTGDIFDKAFIEEMIVHHEGAVAMAKKVLEVSKRPELITLANNIISAQTTEISQMQSWLSLWFSK